MHNAINKHFAGIAADKLAAAIAAVENRTPPHLNAPSEFEKALWNAIKQGIRPHLDGVMPILTQQAFSKETASQKEFRREMYRSESSYLLAQSIQDIYKIVQSDDFLVAFGAELDGILQRTYLGMRKLEKNIVKNVFSVLYLDRVRDPNGYLGIVPYNHANDALGAKGYELKMYPSENIVYRSRECLVFAVRTNEFRVYTLNSTFVIDGDGKPRDVFTHNSGDLGVYILGGVPQHIEIDANRATALRNGTAVAAANAVGTGGVTEVCEVQFSDYSYATNKLDKLENRNSQNEVVTILHTHPKMVARDLTCGTCNGRGELETLGTDGQVVNRLLDGTDVYVPLMHTCPTCNGKKTVDIGTQDVVTVPMQSGDDLNNTNQNIDDLAKGIIAYVTPDITSADFLYKQLKEEQADAKEMLRLQRFENFGESGAAKRIDQEAGQPRLRAIAEGLQTLIENVLRGLLNFEYVAGLYSSRKNEAIKGITVSIPSFFDLLTVAESKENYFANLTLKPLSERYTERLNIIKKQYDSPESEAIFRISYAYTKGANLLTLEELSTNKAMNILTENDVYIAQFIDGIIRFDILLPAAQRLAPIDIAAVPQSEFFKLIDTALAPILAARKAAVMSVLELARGADNSSQDAPDDSDTPDDNEDDDTNA